MTQFPVSITLNYFFSPSSKMKLVLVVLEVLIGSDKLFSQFKNLPDNCSILPDYCKILPDNCKNLPDNCKILPDNCKILPDNCKNLPDNCKNLPDN